MWLDKLVNDFFSFLEQQKFIITANEKVLIIKSLPYIDISEKEQFYSLLFSFIIKNKMDLDNFSYLFDIFFKNVDFKKKGNVKYNDLNSSGSTGILESVVSSYKFNKYNYGATLKYFILNDKIRMDRLIRLAVSNLDSIEINNQGSFFNKVKNSLNIDSLEKEIEIFKSELIKKGASVSDINEIINKIIRNLKDFKKKIRLEIKKEEKKHRSSGANSDIVSRQEIEISNSDIRLLEDISKKIIEKLKKKKAKRYKRSSSGILDIRKTIHKSVCYNQIPLKRIYKKQKKKKRNLIIFTDMSDSVKKYSGIILYFIYSLNKFFGMLETFTFISEVENITPVFKKKLSFNDFFYEINSRGGNSDYNSAFEIFLNKYGDSLDRNTIFIIIGDARNNYMKTDLRSLISIQKKVKEIIWLNPESKLMWGTSDSNMDIYEKIVHKVYQAKTIDDIEKFASEIIFK